jgi:hypothetical protein
MLDAIGVDVALAYGTLSETGTDLLLPLVLFARLPLDVFNRSLSGRRFSLSHPSLQ